MRMMRTEKTQEERFHSPSLLPPSLPPYLLCIKGQVGRSDLSLGQGDLTQTSQTPSLPPSLPPSLRTSFVSKAK